MREVSENSPFTTKLSVGGRLQRPTLYARKPLQIRLEEKSNMVYYHTVKG